MKEEKTRVHTRISPETERKMELAMPNANCQSRNEFVERAICFYSDYILSKEVTNFLAPCWYLLCARRSRAVRIASPV